MNSASPIVMVSDTDPETAETFRSTFSSSDIRFLSVTDVIEELADHRPNVIVIGESDQGGDSLNLVRSLKKKVPKIPVLVVSGMQSSSSAIELVKAGAFDFLSKPLDSAEISRSLREAIDTSRKTGTTVTIDPKDEFDDGDTPLVGNSRAMMDVYKSLGRLSATPVTVLIRGETGTGKELVARALYQHGHRAHRPFITVNCAAIPENLLESELFGHEKGAFTGATANRIGKFEQANDATLFLDEIGDLDHSLQAKLLRVLQEKRFQRVGGTKEISVDTRIIAATHQPIERMISEGKFREDLFYRLNVASIKLPPLRERSGDVTLLTKHFLTRLSRELEVPTPTIAKSALSCLESHPLPGNVRQLQNIIRRAILKARGYRIDRELIEELLEESATEGASSAHTQSLAEWCRELVNEAAAGHAENIHQTASEELEKALFREALHRSGNNISRACEWLGISRITLREKAKRYGILDGD